MRRKIYQDLLLWKEKRSQKEAFLIDGARRVGKSWIVEEFAKNEYESYIMIDFTNTTQAIRSLFTDYAGQLDSFFHAPYAGNWCEVARKKITHHI